MAKETLVVEWDQAACICLMAASASPNLGADMWQLASVRDKQKQAKGTRGWAYVCPGCCRYCKKGYRLQECPWSPTQHT